MKLYYTPLACSLADHIALIEVGASFERERVDLKTKQTASGRDLGEISRKGYVPVMVLDDGEVLTENIAILDWIASQYPELAVGGDLGRTRVLEAMTYISTEIHRSFKPMWHPSSDSDKAHARETIARQFELFSDRLDDHYLFGTRPSVADYYLFVMLLWAGRFGVPVPEPLSGLRERIQKMPAVQAAMQEEGLLVA